MVEGEPQAFRHRLDKVPPCPPPPKKTSGLAPTGQAFKHRPEAVQKVRPLFFNKPPPYQVQEEQAAKAAAKGAAAEGRRSRGCSKAQLRPLFMLRRGGRTQDLKKEFCICCDVHKVLDPGCGRELISLDTRIC